MYLWEEISYQELKLLILANPKKVTEQDYKNLNQMHTLPLNMILLCIGWQFPHKYCNKHF